MGVKLFCNIWPDIGPMLQLLNLRCRKDGIDQLFTGNDQSMRGDFAQLGDPLRNQLSHAQGRCGE